jgi:hypothetical protein
MTRTRWLIGLVTVPLLGILAAWVVPPWRTAVVGACNGESKYQGRYTNYWREELLYWEVAADAISREGPPGVGVRSRFTVWCRSPHPWVERLAVAVGRPSPGRSYDCPLLAGDPDAVPVLMELLRDPDPKVRLIAIQGLEIVGPAAGPAVPALLRALRDKELGDDVFQALGRIDPEKARRVKVRSAKRSR